MKFTCSSEALQNSLRTVRPAISTQSSIPSLSGILIDARSSQVELSATDLKIGIVTKCGAAVATEGKAIVPAETFVGFVSLLLPGEVKLNLHQPSLSLGLESGQFKAKFKCYPPEEFPILPTLKEGALSLESGLLRGLIKQVIISVARDESRPILTGALVEFTKDSLLMVSADGYRLSKASIEGDFSPPGAGSAIVPLQALTEISKLPEGKTHSQILESQILFQSGNTTIISQLIVGQFPDYPALIPSEWKTRATIPTQELLQVCRAVGIFASKGSNYSELEFTEGMLTLSTPSSEIGESQGKVKIILEGEPLRDAFNIKFLAGALSVISSDEVVFESEGEHKALVIRPNDNTDALHIIMPLRTRD